HTRLQGDWSSDVCSSDLRGPGPRFARSEGDGSYSCATSGPPRRDSIGKNHCSRKSLPGPELTDHKGSNLPNGAHGTSFCVEPQQIGRASVGKEGRYRGSA